MKQCKVSLFYRYDEEGELVDVCLDQPRAALPGEELCELDAWTMQDF